MTNVSLVFFSSSSRIHRSCSAPSSPIEPQVSRFALCHVGSLTPLLALYNLGELSAATRQDGLASTCGVTGPTPTGRSGQPLSTRSSSIDRRFLGELCT
jgi:hypothetical protein